MKPKKIIMQAFGTYLEETVIDFSLLNDATLFIISGSTGSGKTTILDAMSFALFGYSTGKQRSFKEMRSDKASNRLATIVSFEFSVGDKSYKFVRTRTPRTVKHRNGEVETEFTDTAEAYEVTETQKLIANSSKTVDKKAEEVLGFNHEQFSQIIVLPQGEFKKLLLANTAEKEKILQVLFDVSRFGRLSEKIKENAISLYREISHSEERKAGLLQSTAYENVDLLADSIERKNNEKTDIEKEFEEKRILCEQADVAYNDAKKIFDFYTELEDCLLKLEEAKANRSHIDELTATVEKYKVISVIMPYFDNFLRQNNEVEENKSKQETETENLNSIVKELQEIDLENRGIGFFREVEGQISDKLKEFNEKISKFEDFEKAEENKKIYEAKSEKIGDDIAENQAEKQALKDRAEKGKVVIEERNNIISTIPSLQAKLDDYTQLKEKQESLETKLAESEKAKSEFENSKILEQAATDTLLEIEKKLSENSAYLLASSLVENTPCPVCGSTDHPNPATMHDENYTAIRLDAHKAIVKTSTDNRIKAETDYNALTAQVDFLQNELLRICEKLKIADLKSVATDEIISKTKTELNTANKYKSEQNTLIKALADIEKQIEEKEEKDTQLNNEKQRICSELAVFTSDYNKLSEELKNIDKTAIDTEVAKLSDEKKSVFEKITRLDSLLIQKAEKEATVKQISDNLKSLEKSLSLAKQDFLEKCNHVNLSADTDFSAYRDKISSLSEMQKELEDYFANLNHLQNTKAELNEKISNQPKPDLKPLEDKKEEARALYDAINRRMGEHIEALKREEKILSGIREIEKENAEKTKIYEKTERLSNLLNGKINPKIQLRTFALAIMFDDVVAAANLYFEKLSRGQYNLVRDFQSASGNAYKGLDLLVFDKYVGDKRPVSTLSGGELFLASMSLAFGLSQVVESYAGGIRLDTIFIDEGFGTLDDETLEYAMKAFDQIRKSGRTVGIISHVAALNSRIGARIEVTKSNDKGSVVKIFDS